MYLLVKFYDLLLTEWEPLGSGDENGYIEISEWTYRKIKTYHWIKSIIKLQFQVLFYFKCDSFSFGRGFGVLGFWGGLQEDY